MSTVLAYFHSLSMIALATLLVVQLMNVGQLHDRAQLQRFLTGCFAIAVAAAVMLLSGAGMVVWSAKGAAFFLRNPVFYIKLALFAAMILVAVTPARIILQWQRQADEGRLPDPLSVGFVKRYLIVELILLLVIPLLAAMAARGVGLQTSPS
jgi:putative membrane protein